MIRLQLMTHEGLREIEVTNPQHCKIVDLIACTYFDFFSAVPRKDWDIQATTAIKLIADGDLISAFEYLKRRDQAWKPVVDLIAEVGIAEDLGI